jgi:collagen type III alpha
VPILGIVIGQTFERLLAVAYAGDLPAAAQRLAHDTIDAPAAVRAGSAVPAPAGSARPASRLPTAAGGASSPSGHGLAQPDRRMSHGPLSGSPHDRHWWSSSAPRTPGSTSGRQEQGISGQSASPGQGSPGQSNPGQGSPGQGSPGQGSPGQGNPGGSPAPTPTQQTSPSASTAPSAGGTQSPSP